MQVLAPTLTTERLTLRPIAPGDFEPFGSFLASPRSKMMGGPYGVREGWGIFCHEVALWQLYGLGGLAVDLRTTGDCIGIVEINGGPLFPEHELGWQVYQAYEGNGYITEAAGALRDWVFAERKLSTLVSYIDPNNSRSIAVAQRLGGVLDHAAPKQDPDDLVFRYRAQLGASATAPA